MQSISSDIIMKRHMLFNSVEFWIFALVFFTGYAFLRHSRARFLHADLGHRPISCVKTDLSSVEDEELI